jgi:uncharacterized protein
MAAGCAILPDMGARKQFQLLIKPAGADCNLRCEYCFYLRAGELYADEKRHVMPDAVLEAVVGGLMGQRFPETVFAWQGGEPTLAGLDFFRKAVALQQQLGAAGQVVGNGIQTNGVLLDDEWCRFLRQYRFLVGLSIDGPEEVHNRHRINAAGRGAWDKAMAAASRMSAHGVPFNVLCVINADNVRMGADLCRWFLGQGFQYLQFIPCAEAGSPYNVPPEEYGRFLCDTFDFWSKEAVGKVSIRDFDAMLAARVQGAPAMCVYGGRCDQYIVVEHNGDVYPCDFFVYPEERLGNVLDAPLESFVEDERYKAFAYRKDKVAACRGCEWRSWCHGGCPKDRLSTGTVADPTPFCEAYKMFFRHAAPRFSALAKRVQRPR